MVPECILLQSDFSSVSTDFRKTGNGAPIGVDYPKLDWVSNTPWLVGWIRSDVLYLSCHRSFVHIGVMLNLLLHSNR